MYITLQDDVELPSLLAMRNPSTLNHSTRLMMFSIAVVNRGTRKLTLIGIFEDNPLFCTHVHRKTYGSLKSEFINRAVV